MERTRKPCERIAVLALLIVIAIPDAASAGGKAAVLRVVSAELPTQFNPFAAQTDVDRQACDLIFERLIVGGRDGGGNMHFHPGLADEIPFGQGTMPTFRLRAGAAWSNGEPITASDVRHSALLWQRDGGTFAWQALLDTPQLGNSPREVRLPLRFGLIEPWLCYQFPIVPQSCGGRDDAEFAKQPLGSGPFALVGPSDKAGAPGVIFRKNSHHLLAASLPFEEIHWFAASDDKSRKALKPDLILDAEQADATTVSTRRVWYVAPNHRHSLLALQDLRAFLAAAPERDKIVDAKRVVNGLTPRDSWTLAAAPRVAADLHRPEAARAFAGKLAKAHPSIALSFKFPAGETAAITQLIDQWQTAARAGGLDLKIQPLPLSARELAQALAKRDFELALASEDAGDSIGRLTALFAGGSNVCGVQDGELQRQIAALPHTRRFPTLREQMQNLHVHLTQTMPVIPLWRHEARYVLSAKQGAGFDPLHPFGDMSVWKK
jgi:ABC-type oligopeptide transport system substrate-binding subunit